MGKPGSVEGVESTYNCTYIYMKVSLSCKPSKEVALESTGDFYIRQPKSALRRYTVAAGLVKGKEC